MLLQILRRFLKPYTTSIVLVIVFQLVQVMASLYLPSLNASIIDQGVARGDTAKILSLGALMLGITLLQIAAQIAAIYFAVTTAMGMGRDLRAALFSRALGFSSQEINRFGAPSLITRNTNDVQQVTQFTMMTLMLIVATPIMMVGGLIMAMQTDIGLSWLIAVAVGALALIIGILLSQTLPLFRRVQNLTDNLNRVLREQISGLRVIRAFVREPDESRRFADANRDLTDTSVQVGRRMMTLLPTVMFIMNVSSIAVMWFGGLRIADGDMAVGQLTAYLQYLMQILMAALMSTMMLMIAPRASVCAGRITEVLDTESSLTAPSNPVLHVSLRSELAFDKVTFTYPGAEHPVLHDVSFAVRAGETTAIIGSTGSGKSTIVGLIPRLFDATSGTVTVDGVDVRDLDADLLWSKIGLVPQKPYLFTGTVASNLRYGKPDASDDELWAALTTAQAQQFVTDKPEGLETPISQGGTNVSGGQRQRLAIARALVKKPEIYVFDDSFSALDVTTDARLRAALARETRDAAVLIVASRVSTIKQADQIIVLDAGRIVGRGTHDELLTSCPTYGEIVESQFENKDAA